MSASENGINRRQLLRTLGLAATGAAIVGAVPDLAGLAAIPAQMQAGGKAFPVTTINHLALAVADTTKSRDFYVDLLGMRVRWDDGKRPDVEFGSMTSPNELYIGPLAKPGDPPTVGHIAFGISNFWAQRTAIKAEMDRLGQTVRPDGEGGWTTATPTGYMVQVVPEEDDTMFPGAASPCVVAKSDKCKTAYEAGLKNLSSAPKPSGNGFKAVGFSRIVLHVPNVAKDVGFFRDFLGMRVLSNKPDECLLKFGANTLDLVPTSNPDDKPYCVQYGFAIENFDSAKVEAELKRRGITLQMDPKWPVAFKDPDGLVIGISDKA
jgi:catechol 2,3-dioxygenase-like lactoylglutathione lyase family enzyme